MDTRTVDAEHGLEPIRRAMLEGGACSVEAEGWRRELVHDPAVDAPLKHWPWPFPLLSPHRIRLQIYEGALRVSTVRYSKGRLDEAIENFLVGVGPKTKIIITRERSLRGARG